MKIKNIYFTGKFLDGDNEYMQDYKGFRGDILVENISGYFYALGFESVESVTPGQYDIEDTYYESSDVYWVSKKDEKEKIELVINHDASHYWIIVEIVNVKVIFETIKKLESTNFFKSLKPVPTPTDEDKKEWTVVQYDNYETDEFYLSLYPEKKKEDRL